MGLRADINVIDFENLRLGSPWMAHDLPSGGRRLLQDAEGYDYTLVAGEITRDHGRGHRRTSGQAGARRALTCAAPLPTSAEPRRVPRLA